MSKLSTRVDYINSSSAIILDRDYPIMNKILKSPIIPQAVNGTLDKDTLSQDIIVKIPSWDDKSIGDVIHVFWGTLHEIYVVQSVNDSVIMVSFSRNAISVGNYSVYYTITDTVGNTGTSTTVSIMVTGGGSGSLATLPAPHIPQATDGVIDLSSQANDIDVKCYPDKAGQPGDILRVHFGKLLAEITLTFPVAMTPSVFVPRSSITHGNYVVYYEILRAGNQVAISASVDVDAVLDIFLPAPVFPTAVNGVVNLKDEGLFVEMDIPRYDSAERGDEIYSYIGITKGPVTIIEYPDNGSFPVKFKKESLEAGTFKAHYEVRKMDDYQIASPSISVILSDSITPPATTDDVWENIKAGIPFTIYNKVPAYTLSEEGRGSYYVLWQPKDVPLTIWKPVVININLRTFKVISRDGYYWSMHTNYLHTAEGGGTLFSIERSDTNNSARRIVDTYGKYLRKCENSNNDDHRITHSSNLAQGSNIFDFYFNFLS